MDLDDRPAPGGTPDEELASSPDVAPDGSIASESPTVADLDPDQPDYTWRIRALLGVIALAVVLVVGFLLTTGAL